MATPSIHRGPQAATAPPPGAGARINAPRINDPACGPSLDGTDATAGDDYAISTQRPGIASLLKDLRDETTALLRNEVALAKTEVTEKATKAGRNVAYFAAGGVVLLAGALGLMAAAAHGLAALLQRADVQPQNAIWIAWLIVGGAIATIGYIFVHKGLATLREMTPVPQKTIESLKEDKQWLTNKISS